MTNLAWHFRGLTPPGAPRQLQPSILGTGKEFQRSSVASRIELFREAKRNHQVHSTRARSKQQRDQERVARRLEKIRILQEAHYDNMNSLGEVDALSDSTVLGVNRGEVLRDPKLRPQYQHPALRE